MSMPDVLPRLPVGGSWSWRYSENQTAIFAVLTRVNRPHHQARGFDQARELDRARHSKLMYRSVCNRTDISTGQFCREARKIARGDLCATGAFGALPAW